MVSEAVLTVIVGVAVLTTVNTMLLDVAWPDEKQG
jgi:hypothetical protein